MISDVFGIKEFQTNLPKIARKIRNIGGHYLVTKRNQPSLVAIPFSDYQALEDILLELNSPALLKDIEKGRKEHLEGKTKKLEKILKTAS